jgi:regulator of sirC expression with transglutaminase-like and TPR domain
LQRLGRIDDAVASIDDALKINDSNAAAYEQKGMILWSAQRYSDARPALEMYLQLAPDGRKADTIRNMLDEPR